MTVIEICIKEREKKGYDRQDAEKLCVAEYATLD